MEWDKKQTEYDQQVHLMRQAYRFVTGWDGTYWERRDEMGRDGEKNRRHMTSVCTRWDRSSVSSRDAGRHGI